MKIVIASLAALAALTGCSPYADQPVATTYPNREVVVTPTTVVTYQPVATPAPVYQAVPATMYVTQMPAPIVVPGNTYLVERDPPRGDGVSVGTSPQPVLTPNQKEQDKTMSSR
jgi:hypothetical protein